MSYFTVECHADVPFSERALAIFGACLNKNIAQVTDAAGLSVTEVA